MEDIVVGLVPGDWLEVACYPFGVCLAAFRAAPEHCVLLRNPRPFAFATRDALA